MKQLSQVDTSLVAGGVIYLGDGVYLQVSSEGIPSHAFNYIESLEQQVYNGTMTSDTLVDKVISAGYTDYYLTYADNFLNNKFEITFA